MSGEFSENLLQSKSLDTKFKLIKINDEKVKLQIWDTQGDNKHKALTRNFFKKATGIALVFDLSDENAMEKVKSWMEEVKANEDTDTCKILVGNKSDLVQEESKIAPEKIEEFVDQNEGLRYFEVSAKENKNIEEIFTYLSEEAYKVATENRLKGKTIQGLKLSKVVLDQDPTLNRSGCRC
jgi:small GTP-binding protein